METPEIKDIEKQLEQAKERRYLAGDDKVKKNQIDKIIKALRYRLKTLKEQKA